MSRRPTDSLTSGARGALPFALGWALLSVIGNLATMLVDETVAPGIPNAARRVLLLLIAAAIFWGFLYVRRDELQRVWWRLTGKTGLEAVSRPSPPKKAGIIALVSLGQSEPADGSETLDRAVRHHRPRLRRVWLLTTARTTTRGEEIAARLRGQGLQVDLVPLPAESEGCEEFEVRGVKECVEEIYRAGLGDLAEDDVIADFTGGTKVMSVGMIFACLSSSRSLEYVPAKYGQTGGPVETLPPVLYTFAERLLPEETAG